MVELGIGTASGLDGEMVFIRPHTLFGSKVQVRSGSLKARGKKFPLLRSTLSKQKDTFTASALTQNEVGEQILAIYPYKNLFFAVKITGRF